MSEPPSQELNPLPLKSFLLLLLALAVLAGLSLWLTAWCWPRYGESACGRIVLPVDFLMSLAIFALVTLVFDQRWVRLVLYSIAISAAVVFGSLIARMVYTATALPFQNLPDFLRYLEAALVRLLYLALIQIFVPAIILRLWLRREAQRINLNNAAMYGLIVGLLYTLFTTALFWLASIIQPGSVAPGSIITWNNLLSAPTLGLAAFLGVLLGKKLR
jgi:hypothetical protein